VEPYVHAFMAWWLIEPRDNFTLLNSDFVQTCVVIYRSEVKWGDSDTHRRHAPVACSPGGRDERCLQTFRSRRRKWEDNIRMDLREILWEVVWIRLPQDRDQWRAVVNTVMNLRVP